MRHSLLRAVYVTLAAAGAVSAQVPPPVPVTPSQGSRPCPAGTNFETSHYRIGDVSIKDPFAFLRVIGHEQQTLQTRLNALRGHPFTYQTARAEPLQWINASLLTPDTPSSYRLIVERILAENCNSSAKTLDLRYEVFSTAPPKFLGGSFESHRTTQSSPQTTSGLANVGTTFHLLPFAGYSRSFGLFGGGRLETLTTGNLSRYVNSFVLEGHGSQFLRFIDAELNGSSHSFAWLTDTHWKLHYTNESAPAGDTNLATAALSAQVDTQSRSFWNGNAFARAGFLLQGGNLQGTLSPALLAAKTVRSAGFGSLKLFTGLSSRTAHNALSASYGLELGSIGHTGQVDWRKHIADIADDFWLPVRDHKPLEVESRLTIGALQVPHVIPFAARFFGGNVDHSFIPNAAWQIRDQPVLRSLPANQLYLTAHGAGADTFTALNLTFSYPLFSRPLVPREATADPDVKTQLNSAFVSAENIDQNYYAWKDPSFSLARAALPALEASLSSLENDLSHVNPSGAPPLQADLDSCTGSIELSKGNIDDVGTDKGQAQLGDLQALLPADPDNNLQGVVDACRIVLAEIPPSATAQAHLAAIVTQQASLISHFNAIDQAAANRKAHADLQFAERTIRTLFNDVNIVSVAPVAVFDFAHFGPAQGPFGGTRIGPGGGVRLELASAATFTLGYAVNANRKPGEDHGAVFFAIGFRDLFH